MTDKSRFKQWVDQRQTMTSDSRRRLAEFGASGIKPKYVLKQANLEYKEHKRELRKVKRDHKRELTTNKNLLESKKALKQAEADLVTMKATGDQAAIQMAQVSYNAAKNHHQATLAKVKGDLKPDLDQATSAVKVAKKTKKEAAKRAGGTTGKKLAGLAKNSAHVQVSRTLNDVLSEEDTLGDVANARYKFTQANMAVGRSRFAGRILGNTSKYIITRSYNVGNRFYNLKQGRGFTVTPKEFSWHGRAGARFRAWKNGLRQKRSVQTWRGAKRVGSWVVKPVLTVLKNPLTFKSYVYMFLGVLLLAFLGFGGGVTIQDEYDLNQTWLYLTKKDREKSTDKVDYWTNWEDSLLYINHHYDTIAETYNLTEAETMPDQLLGQAYLNVLWDKLNKDEDNLKTMADLYKKKGEVYYLETDDLEAYEELLEEAKETGKFASLLELANPFYLPDDPKAELPLKITNRFGYIDKRTVNEDTSLLANSGQAVYATIAGTVEVKGDDVTISDGEAKFTYKDLASLRVKTGDQVNEQDLLGATSGTQLVITYQKHLVPTKGEKDSQGNIKPEWIAVNPGFYFQNVEYTQATSVISSIDVSGDKAQRARSFYNIIKKHIPEATIEGVSAALGGYDIESGITFKRYETDRLTGNQFDKMAQEPTVENLLGSWSAFTDLYPGWNLNEQGYLVNGLHYLGVGIGQWTGLRALALWSFAQANNLDMWSEEAQIRFLLEGDSPYYREVFRKTVTGTGSTDELTEYFLNSWLGVPGNKLRERQNSAKQWANFLKGRASGTTGVATQTIPAGYADKLPYGLPTDRAVLEGQGYPGNGYELGNCTWYVYNRMHEVGTPIYAYLGNANVWAESGRARGYEISTTPKPGSAAVFLTGVAGSHPTWGHVGFVEHVNADGTFLMSEMNFTGLYNLTWRTLSPQPGIYFMTPK